MRKFLLINTLILIIGYGMAQTPKVTGDFDQSFRCVSPSQGASFRFVNASPSQAGITHVKWEIKDDVSGTVLNTNSDASNLLSYLYLFFQTGTYRCVMTVSWGNLVRMDSMKVVVYSQPPFLIVESNDTVMGNTIITQTNTCANDTAIITAMPNAGYRFIQWHDGNSQNPRTIIVTQDTSFVATFGIVSQGIYHVSVIANNPSIGSVTGSGDYAVNSTITISATAKSGYRFVQWNDGNTNNPRTITVTQDTTFTAIFVSVIYHVLLTSNNTNMGSVTGSGDYAANSTITISAIANSNYRFVQWNDGNSQNPRTITVTKDTTFTAIFVSVIYHVLVTSNNTNMGSVTGSGDYAVNSTVTISATAKSGYYFVQWNDGNTNNPRTITVTKDTAFTAIFATFSQITYHVSVTANNPSMGSLTGSGDYTANSTATIGAIASPGYRFVQWTDGNTNNPRSIIVTQDTSFLATFTIVSQGMYHVSVTANNPSMGSVTGSGDYAANSTATIGAIASPGYRFVQWTDGNTNNPRSIIVSSDTSFTVEFAVSVANMYHVTVSTTNINMGAVTGSGDYTANSTVTIGAIASLGYRFIQWTDGNSQNPRIITVLSDTTFTAEFATAIQGIYNVSAIANNPNMGSVTGSGDYAANTVVTITATPKISYHFVQWNDGNNQNPRTITVTQDTSFIAIFVDASQNIYRITVLSNDQTKGIVMGGGDFPANTTTTLGAIANPGYRFVQWNDGNTDNPRSITVTRDTTFIATFKIATAIKDIEASAIAIYPNPAKDNIHITLPTNVHQATFILYDMQGKVLIRKEISSQDVVSVSNFAASVYIYNVITEKQNHRGKLIINN